ncbi:hypothetical protein MRX96_026549 [Rhipicephalus microplus]
MYGFHFLVWLFTVRGIADTQCGFKLFSREAATHLFTSLHVERWAFDVEILYIAQALKFPVAEVAVHWTEIEGSKVVPVWTWIEMGRDLFPHLVTIQDWCLVYCSTAKQAQMSDASL